MNKHIETIIFDRNKTLNQAQTWIDAMNDRKEQKAGHQIVQHANGTMGNPRKVSGPLKPRIVEKVASNDLEDYERVQEIKGTLLQYTTSL